MTGVILAGGDSRRMGKNKALLPFGKVTIIEYLIQRLAPVFDEILISTKRAEDYAFLPCLPAGRQVRVVADLLPEAGVLGGIYSALSHSSSSNNFFIACDMPFIKRALVEYLMKFVADFDAVIAESPLGPQPLPAFYSKASGNAIEKVLRQGKLRIVDFYPSVRMKVVRWKEVAKFDPQGLSFFNINTYDDYIKALALLRDKEHRFIPAIHLKEPVSSE
jgi:FdhD protein